MLHPAHKIGLAVIFCGLLLFPNSMWSQREKQPRRIQDDGELFGEKAIDEANAIIAKIKQKHNKDLFIETVRRIPEKVDFAKWTAQRFDDFGIDGIYILISTQPKHFEIVVGAKTRDKFFTAADRDEVRTILAKNLKDNRDEALVKIAKYTLEAMDKANKTAVTRFKVKDDAKLFGEGAVKDANDIIAKIRDTHGKDLAIETLEKGPTVADFPTWTRDRATKLGVNGVYVVISVMPRHFHVFVDDKTRDSKLFTISDRDEVVKMLKGLGDDRDDTLLKVGNYVLEAMNQRTKPDKDEGKKEGDATIEPAAIHATIRIKILTNAVLTYRLRHAEYPRTLGILIEDDKNKMRFALKDDLVDPWKNPYRYDPAGPRNNGTKPDIWTEAPNGQIIGNWPKLGKGESVEGKIDVAKIQVQNLSKAVKVYFIKKEEYPRALSDLVDAKYVEKEDLIDPWKRPYQYDFDGPKNKGMVPDIWTVTPEKQVIGNWPK